MAARRPALPGWIEVLAAGFAPGALFGTHLAGLIFFLNPDLPFAPLPLLRGIATYAGLLGLAGLLLHLPFTWRRRRRARRWLPWALTLALAAAAALDGAHASYYAYFLPAGINDRLIRTALWLGLGALVAFYTALLHTLHRRRYGRRSRAGYAVIVLFSVAAMVERREAFRPRPPAAHRPAHVETGSRPRLFVVGIESATLDAILPLAGQGRLPFLAAVLREGAYGRLESLSPVRREALWTTLATGKYPFRHGVIGGKVYDARWIGPRAELRLLPVWLHFRRWGTLGDPGRSETAYPRRALALWEVLPRLGIPAGVVGWPASAPASRETAFALPDRFFFAGNRGSRTEAGTAWPEDLGERARLFRALPQEIDRRLRAQLLGPAPAAPLHDALAGDLWRQALALALEEQHPEAEGLFLVLPGLREVSRRSFGGFHARQFEGEQSAELEEAAERLAAYYLWLDRFLADLWSRGEGPRVLAVVSPYGVEPRAGTWGEGDERGGRFGGAADGALLLYGEGIRPGALLTGTRLVDVAPTLLYALGVPVARDLDGQVITAAFDRAVLSRNPLTFLTSYDALTSPARPRRP